MFTDIVIPENNEEDFIDMAKKLGIDKLIFCYRFSDFDKYTIKDRNIEKGIITDSRDIRKAKKKCDFVISNSNDRYVFDNPPNLVFELEKLYGKDSMHFRNSGMNQVLFKIAHKNKIKLGVSLSMILNSSQKNIPVLMGRMMQNIKLARKYKVDIKIASFARTPYEMRPAEDLKNFLNLFSVKL